LVITHNSGFQAEGCVIVGSLGEAIEKAKRAEGNEEIFVIGGESIYKEALPLADRLYLTKVDAEIEGDKLFKYNSSDWDQKSSQICRRLARLLSPRTTVRISLLGNQKVECAWSPTC